MFYLNIADIAPDRYKLAMNVEITGVANFPVGTIVNNRVSHMLLRHGITQVCVEDINSGDYDPREFVDSSTLDQIKKILKANDNLDLVKPSCVKLADSIIKNPKLNVAINVLAHKCSKTDSVIDHCISTSIYAGVIAIGMGLDYETITTVVTTGILHDIGKIKIPDKILFSDDTLSEKERKVMNRHSLEGYRILSEYKWITDEIRTAVLQHHENYDGTGYPIGLRGKNISLLARIVHVADVYDALIRTRAYKAGWQPHKAYNYIIQKSGTMFDPEIVESFKENMAVFEIGTLVRLSDNQLAVVIKNRKNYILQPTVSYVENNQQLDLYNTNIHIENAVYV